VADSDSKLDKLEPDTMHLELGHERGRSCSQAVSH
jgi:hypothetical protein